MEYSWSHLTLGSAYARPMLGLCYAYATPTLQYTYDSATIAESLSSMPDTKSLNFSAIALSDIRVASALASPLHLPCYKFWLSGIVFDFFEEVLWDISSSQTGLQAFDINHNPVLAGDTCNTSNDSLKWTIGDSYNVI